MKKTSFHFIFVSFGGATLELSMDGGSVKQSKVRKTFIFTFEAKEGHELLPGRYRYQICTNGNFAASTVSEVSS